MTCSDHDLCHVAPKLQSRSCLLSNIYYGLFYVTKGEILLCYILKLLFFALPQLFCFVRKNKGRIKRCIKKIQDFKNEQRLWVTGTEIHCIQLCNAPPPLLINLWCPTKGVKVWERTPPPGSEPVNKVNPHRHQDIKTISQPTFNQ